MGKVALVECWNTGNNPKRVGRPADADPPPGYHWDRWLGPAPLVPFNPARLKHHWWFDYSGGMLTNWTIHHLDTVVWAMQAGWPTSVVCNGGKVVADNLADTPDLVEAAWKFPDFLLRYSYRGFNTFPPVQNRIKTHGICFYGSQATLVLDRDGYELWEAGDRSSLLKRRTTRDRYATATRSTGRGNTCSSIALRAENRRRLASRRVTARTSPATWPTSRTGRVEPSMERPERDDPGDARTSKLLSRPRRKGYELPKV